MFKRVLVGVDLRQGGRDAIALAQTLADPDASLTLVYVSPGRLTRSHAVTARLLAEDRARGERELERERGEAGVDAELVVTQGASAGRVLHEQAEQRSADLIVLGSCSRGVFGRAMLGDDTRSAVNGAPCAVAVAPTGYAQNRKALERIGVGYDGSRESEAALAVARELAAPTHAVIRAEHIVGLPTYAYGAIGPAVLANLDAAVENAEKRMQELEGVQGHADYGLSSEDLADFSEEVDLLVVGSRGYGPWGRLVHGSTSSRLARHTRGPLLIVPRGTRPEPGESEQDVAADQAAVPA